MGGNSPAVRPSQRETKPAERDGLGLVGNIVLTVLLCGGLVGGVAGIIWWMNPAYEYVYDDRDDELTVHAAGSPDDTHFTISLMPDPALWTDPLRPAPRPSGGVHTVTDESGSEWKIAWKRNPWTKGLFFSVLRNGEPVPPTPDQAQRNANKEEKWQAALREQLTVQFQYSNQLTKQAPGKVRIDPGLTISFHLPGSTGRVERIFVPNPPLRGEHTKPAGKKDGTSTSDWLKDDEIVVRWDFTTGVCNAHRNSAEVPRTSLEAQDKERFYERMGFNNRIGWDGPWRPEPDNYVSRTRHDPKLQYTVQYRERNVQLGVRVQAETILEVQIRPVGADLLISAIPMSGPYRSDDRQSFVDNGNGLIVWHNGLVVPPAGQR